MIDRFIRKTLSKESGIVFVIGIILFLFTHILSLKLDLLVLYYFALIFVSMVAGIVPGLGLTLVGHLLGLVINSSSMIYLPVSILVVLFTYIFSKAHFFRTWWKTFIGAGAIGLIAVYSALMIFFISKVGGPFEIMYDSHFNLAQNTTTTVFAILFDVLLSVLLSVFALHFFEREWLENLEVGDRYYQKNTFFSSAKVIKKETYPQDTNIIGSHVKFTSYLPKWLTNINSMFYYVVFLMVLGVAFFATSLFTDSFTTPFTGDYCAQQFSFYTNGYDDWWHFFKTGEFVLYDSNTFLGVDNIGSNSFYYLFDPFFMPILLCPRQLVPQGMAVLTIIKITLCGVAFYAYLRYMGASKKASKIIGIAYAFSGWMTWYLWFNHFTEIAIAFPLILLGIEIVLRTKKPWFLMGSLCLMGFVNYFFLISFTMCAFLYAMFRYFQRLKLNSWSDNLIIISMGFLGFFVGLLLPMMVVFPSAMHALTSPRAKTADYLNLLKEALKAKNIQNIFKLLTSWKAVNDTQQNRARELYPFIEFIYPVTSCRGTPLTRYGNETYDNVAGSYYCFLPVTMLLVPAFIDSFKKKHFSVLVPLAFFIFALFTPFFYYLLHGFTQPYSRWTLFVTTSIMGYVGLYLDKLKKEKFWVLILGFLSILALAIVGAVMANKIVTTYEGYKPRSDIKTFAIIECIYIFCMCLVIILLVAFKRKRMYTIFTAFIVAEVCLMGGFVIDGHGISDYVNVNKGVTKNDVLHALTSKIKQDDNSYYRSYSSLGSSTASNDGMRNDYNGFNFFHSVYNYNTADICNWSVVTNGTAPGSWSGNYVQKRPNFDLLLGVKYYFVEDDYYRYQSRRAASSEQFRYNVPFNYVDVTDQYPNSEFRVFKNADYIDFALTYDTIYPTNGDPTEKEIYTGFYSSTYHDLLGTEELYLSGAIINDFRDKTVIPDIEANHPDIKVKTLKSVSAVSSYGRPLTLTRYKKIPTVVANSNGTITFFDILSGTNSNGKQVNSLGLSAKEYVDLLVRTNDTFKKYGSPNSYENSRQWVAVIEAKNGEFPKYDPKGNIYFINEPYTNGYETDIYFVDENNEIVTYDNHNDGFCSNNKTGKDIRAFYITPQYEYVDGVLTITKPAPKISKIIITTRGKHINSSFNIYIDKYSDRELRMRNIKQHQVTDVDSTRNNVFTFKTNFDKERLVVTRLAYADGFTLKIKDNKGNVRDAKVFNGQGGFVSFISGVGECSYELEFYTPHLKLAGYVSAVAAFSAVTSYLTYFYFGILAKRKREVIEMLNEKRWN